jgi:hypothetical protein
MTDIVGKLWGCCHTLRHDGIDYGDYIEQLTYLLFLKMIEEKGAEIPPEYSWAVLREKSGTELTDHYMTTLRKLGEKKGMLGDIYAGAMSRFSNPVNLKRLVNLIDEVEWTGLNVDVKAAAYEGEELLRSILSVRPARSRDYIPRDSHEPCGPDSDQVKEVPNGWALASFDQLSCLVKSGSRGWAKHYSNGGPLFIRAQNINKDDLCLDDVAHVIPPLSGEGRRTLVQLGDILITLTGANVTRSALVKHDIGEAHVSQHVSLVRPGG